MSLTSENILKSADVILGKEEKKEAEKSLKELEEKLKYPPRSLESERNFYAPRMSEKIMQIFLQKKLEPMTRETIFENLKRDTDWHAWHGYVHGSDGHRLSFCYSYSYKNDEILSRLRIMCDDILRVLVENNYIQYNCYSTVCHYIYRGKK